MKITPVFASIAFSALIAVALACGKTESQSADAQAGGEEPPTAVVPSDTTDAAQRIADGMGIDKWSQVAMNMHQRIVAGGGSLIGDISPDQWDPAISSLQPTRVYVYKGHFMVVQEGGGGQEAGVVLTNPVSSEAIGMEDKDGYTFTRQADGLMHFTRGIVPITATTSAPSP